jgi:hypothetical protein
LDIITAWFDLVFFGVAYAKEVAKKVGDARTARKD